MTFCIVLANEDQIIQATDRRLTSAGKIIDDYANKSCHVICNDASLLVCFTGLARVGDHITSKWLLETISKTSLVKGCSYYDVIDFLAEEATKFFKLSKYIKNLRARDRRLTIMITGYNFDGFLVNTLISNYQDFENFKDNIEANDDFSVYSEKSNSQFVGNQTFIQAIGQFGAITDDDVAELISMLESKKPAEAIRQKAISLIQEISDRHSSGGTVGKKINTARLERINLYSPVIGYSSDQVEKIYSCLIRLF